VKKNAPPAWEPFGKLKKVDLAIFDDAAERYAAFLSVSLE